MPKITFPTTGAAHDVEAGSDLLDFLQSNDSPISLGCTSGACGTCTAIVECEEGAVQALTTDEEELLEHTTDAPNARLCCQLKVNGDISISPLP
jgi:ferredoxin